MTSDRLVRLSYRATSGGSHILLAAPRTLQQFLNIANVSTIVGVSALAPALA